MGIDIGHIERSMRELTFGVVRGQRDLQRQRRLEGLHEREEGFQITVTGRAEEFPAWQEVHLKFDTVFVNATGQRDSDLTEPQVSTGVVCKTGGPVGLLGCVTEWDINDRDEIDGCKLSIGPVSSDVARKFRAEFHVTFQGYGMPVDHYGDSESFDAD